MCRTMLISAWSLDWPMHKSPPHASQHLLNSYDFDSLERLWHDLKNLEAEINIKIEVGIVGPSFLHFPKDAHHHPWPSFPQAVGDCWPPSM